MRIVEYSAPPEAAFAEVRAAEPRASIAADQELWRTAGGVILRDGSIVIAEAGARRVLHYGAEGVLIRELAGRGDGPGEFQDVAWIGRLDDDRFAVWDRARRTVSFFGPGGYEDRTAYPPDGLPLEVAGLLADDAALVQQQVGVLEEGALVRPVHTLSVMARGAAEGDSVATVPAGQRVVIDGVLVTPPWARRPLFAFGAGSGFVYSPSDPFELHRYDATRLSTIVRRLARPVPVPDDATVREPLRGHHETMPAVSGLLLDRQGNVWVRPAVPAEATTVDWEVYDAAGEQLGYVTLRANITPLDIRGDIMLVLETDDVGAEVVRLLAVERERGGTSTAAVSQRRLDLAR